MNKKNKDEKEEENPSSSDSTCIAVKSRAVVKYSNVQALARFSQLRCNTDLNLPPSNWLSCSVQSYGLQHQPSQNATGFTSFHMAHLFPDCIGEVDVVSDAENIKKLLKLPYSKGTVSMMVHRVGNTLLIDDFDIHKHLLRRAESEWAWLRKFFFEHILETINHKEKINSQKNNKRNALQQRNLNSKFLYHSLDIRNAQPLAEASKAIPLPNVQTDPPLPEPQPEEKLPGSSTSQHEYSRNVVWTFEDIQMLIGTDMPIFGGTTHPCVSLRLRDMEKPINVLTGLDYWLDNLMCNVPELVMCYHLHGIVQRYELIKTEDLPFLENSKFSPRVVRDVAQNILSFLKSNTTKAGHTYWLFKGKDDEVVKLYDLTSLCLDVSEDKDQNPFTVPVAMLLYRVARNLSRASEEGSRNIETIHFLLERCISLLDKKKYPQIVTSAHYMLSDVFVPGDTDPASPGSLDGEVVISKLPKSAGEVALPLNNLCLANEGIRQPRDEMPLAGPEIRGAHDRCVRALDHVFKGLETLKYLPDEPIQKKNEESATLAKPYEPIPMPYSPLNKSNEISERKEEKKTKEKKKIKNNKIRNQNNKSTKEKNVEVSGISLFHQSELPPPLTKDGHVVWKLHLERLLKRKATLVYATLAEDAFLQENYGIALAYIKYLIIFFKKSINYNDEIQSYLVGRAGDCCCMLNKNWSKIKTHEKDFIETSQKIPFLDQNDEEIDESLPDNFSEPENLLSSALQLYGNAIRLSQNNSSQNNLIKRLGNIHNELGTLFIKQASLLLPKIEQLEQNQKLNNLNKVEQLLSKSQEHLDSGIQAFERVHDSSNLALLHSNMGRLLRLKAYALSSGNLEKNLYNRAISCYNKALNALGNRDFDPLIWDSVKWEMSTTLFNLATLSQDYPSLTNTEELEREVSELILKAIKHCDADTPGSRQPIYQFRKATLYHRLGSLYHNSYRHSCDDSRKKSLSRLAILNYEKAYNLFIILDEPASGLRSLLENIALRELQFTSLNNTDKKLKSVTEILEVISKSVPIITYISKNCDFSKINETNKEFEEEFKLTEFYLQRLRFALLSLIKLLNSNTNKENQIKLTFYKSLYSTSLKINIKINLMDLVDLIHKL